MCATPIQSIFFFFNDTATTEIYTLSLHDALPILSQGLQQSKHQEPPQKYSVNIMVVDDEEDTLFTYDSFLSEEGYNVARSEEHTSELQSRQYLVCRLLLEKKKNTDRNR